MGEMGGGLGFLNKKPWHPGSMQNMEKTVKREIEAEKIIKKNEDRIKELKKDRELEELLRLNNELGSNGTRNVSLDWMYGSGITAKSSTYSEKNTIQDTVGSTIDGHFNSPTSNEYTQICDNASSHFTSEISKNEIWRRMIYDPAVKVMQLEINRRQNIRANPFTIRQLEKQANSKRLNSKKKVTKKFRKR